MHTKGRYFRSSGFFVNILIVINLVIISIAFWYYRIEKEALIDQKIKVLTNICEIKLEAIADWRNERLSDARYLFSSPSINESFKELVSDPANTIYKKTLHDNLNGMFLNGKYESMVGLDNAGQIFFLLGNGTEIKKFFQKSAWDSNYRSDGIIMGDFTLCEQGTDIMQINIPMIHSQGNHTSRVGSLVLNINLEKTFFPLLESLPFPSDPMQVIFETPENDSLMQVNRLDSPAIKRNKAIHEPALAVKYPIPDSKAFITVKLTGSGGAAEIRKLRFNILLFCGLMILAFTSTLSFFWMKQRNELTSLEMDKRLLVERFDMLSRFANDAIIVFTEDLTILQVNDKALELYGYTRDEILGMSVELLRSHEFRSEIAGMLKETILKGGQRFETVHMSKNEQKFPVEVSLRYMELMGSQCFQAVVRDISQRKQFEKALITSEERLRLITNTVPMIVWTAASDGTFDFVNSRFQALTGRLALGDKVKTDFIHPDDQERVISYWKKAIYEPKEHQIRFRIRMKEGTFRWFLCLAMPMCNKEGQIIRWYGSATDIDEIENRVAQRTAEIKEHEKEIVKLNSSLQEHTYNLENANKELEAFIFSVSHDLRAPLRAINGFSLILLDDYKNKLDSEGQQMLEKVWINADRMRHLIDDLLRLSKTGRQELSYAFIDMQALFISMIEEVRQIYPDRDIKIDMNDLPGIHGDLALVKQVLMNLLSNAVKFSGKRKFSQIEIGAEKDDSEISYYIKDNGTGFDMKFAHELFGVFKRLNNADEYEGTGVGLALVKRIIDKHGGRVWADSIPDKGATFYFSIPNNRFT